MLRAFNWKEFEDAMRSVLGASNKRVNERMDEMQASNKKRRAARKPDDKKPS